MKKVLLGMSGGIDSSMSALLLQEQGYSVSGIYLKLHNNDKKNDFFIDRANNVAKKLGINFEVLDLQDKFKKLIYEYFLNSYKNGITPNPCAMCNREIKFGLFFDYAMSNGFDYVATGHYIKNDGKFIYEGDDPHKDQSYFLFYIKPDHVKKILFPLASWDKKNLMKFAKEKGFYPDIDNYVESNEICFVENTYIETLRDDNVAIDNVGDVIDTKGDVIGKHKGYMQYTIGKRKGFTLVTAHEPHYVVGIDSVKNQITVAKKNEINTKKFMIENINLFVERKEFNCDVKVRYRGDKHSAKVKVLDNNLAKVTLDNEIEPIAYGQGAVFYEGKKLIGGGWITKQFSL